LVHTRMRLELNSCCNRKIMRGLISVFPRIYFCHEAV
jgi:hypothetical protein